MTPLFIEYMKEMKIKSILILTMAFLIFSCQKNEDIQDTSESELEININNLKGSWLAIEATENSGDGIGEFRDLLNSEEFTYDFKENMSVFDSFIDCDGTYNLTETTRILDLNFQCIEEEIIWKISSLRENQMTLSSEVSEESLEVKFLRK
jgi:hypothetical protein